jgi:uncharacterized membrane protein YqjE
MRIGDGTQALRMIQVTRSVVADVRALRRNTLDLVQLDAQLAAASAVLIAVLSVLALVLVITGWALLVSALVTWIADNWLSLPATLLVVAVLVLAAAIPCVIFIKARARNLAFEATRRQMAGPAEASRPSRSAAEIRDEIAVLERRIADEKQRLQSALRATRGLVRDTLSSRKARTGLLVAAAAAGAVAGLRFKSLAAARSSNRH